MRIEGDGVNPLAIFGLILGGVAVTFAGLALFFDGYERGHRIGKQQGYEEGFTAGKIRADEWWSDAESGVQKAREEIWKDEG